MKEIQDTKDILRDFNNLGVSALVEEEMAFAQKMDEIVNEVAENLQLISSIDDEIEELEVELAEKDIDEIIDVEMIRSKTNLKRAEKHLKKMESLINSKMNVDVNVRDKARMRKNQVKLMIMRRMLGTAIDDGKVLLEEPSSFKVIQISGNSSKESSSEFLWNKIKESSEYIQEWEALFRNQQKCDPVDVVIPRY